MIHPAFKCSASAVGTGPTVPTRAHGSKTATSNSIGRSHSRGDVYCVPAPVPVTPSTCKVCMREAQHSRVFMIQVLLENTSMKKRRSLCLIDELAAAVRRRWYINVVHSKKRLHSPGTQRADVSRQRTAHPRHRADTSCPLQVSITDTWGLLTRTVVNYIDFERRTTTSTSSVQGRRLRPLLSQTTARHCRRPSVIHNVFGSRQIVVEIEHVRALPKRSDPLLSLSRLLSL